MTQDPAGNVPTSTRAIRASTVCRPRHERPSLFFPSFRYARTSMSHVPLKTYLRTYRRRSGLSQEEMAFLLGAMSGTSVSRHETGRRLPILETALAYEFILEMPTRTLYEGLFAGRRSEVQKRARGLCRSLEKKRGTPRRNRKIALLKRLIGTEVMRPS